MAWSSEDLKKEYDEKASLYNSLCEELSKQIEELLREGSVALAVPLEARVKTLGSILDKCERTGLEPEDLSAIGDIAGLRVVVLFRRDSDKAREIIRENFEVLREEDTADRLAEDQFGYGSIHFEVTPNEEWLKLPTLRKLEGLTAEIQLRTGSQHIWAASSHVLQYKKEIHVPAPIRRAINRVAALLETVDLEFERVLAEREAYEVTLEQPDAGAPLDVDRLRSVLKEILPAYYETGNEAYTILFDNLSHFGYTTVSDLRALVHDHLEAAQASEREVAKGYLASEKDDPERERLAKGRAWNYVGVTHEMLRLAVGEERWNAKQLGSRES